MLVVQNLTKENHLSEFKMAAMPIYGKKRSNQNYCVNKADILHEAYGTAYYIK